MIGQRPRREAPVDEAEEATPGDHFHEQIVAIIDGQLHWGWHGDLPTWAVHPNSGRSDIIRTIG